MNRTKPGRTVAAVIATVAVFAISACGGAEHGSSSSGHDQGSAAAPAGSPSAGAVFNDADAEFAEHMIVHHGQAVEMAELAADQAGDSRVKELAARIGAAQAPEIATMSGWLTSWGRSAPDAHGAEHETMPGMMSEQDMKKLAGAEGAAFDEQFLTMMIAHHEGAVVMAGEQAGAGLNPEAKALADTIATSQQAEITEMKELLAGAR
jgi:uncharacterized protein (DUF305 family)